MLNDSRYLRGVVLAVLLYGGFLLAMKMLAMSGERSLVEQAQSPCPRDGTDLSVGGALRSEKRCQEARANREARAAREDN